MRAVIWGWAVDFDVLDLLGVLSSKDVGDGVEGCGSDKEVVGVDFEEN